ncbi:TPA: restriction endonuclease subunit S [Streptococcus suis]
MPNKDRNIPKRRFKEFENEDAWELRKLGEVAIFAKGKGYSKQDLVADGSPIILYGRLYTKYETIISEIDTFISVNETRNAVFSEGGEVLVPASGESPADIARASVVTKKGIILGGDLNIIRLNSKISPTFLALTISNGKPQKELSKRAQGKSVVHLHNSDLKEVEFVTPSLPEQEAIGTFFSTLDQQITLHQRKLDKLKNVKQAYLSEMFPAEGERVPKRRFPGFTDDWELRPLGEIGNTYTGLSGKTKDDFGHGDGRFVTYMNVFSNPISLPEMVEAVEIDESQNTVRYGDILFTTSSETPEEVGMSSVWLGNTENTYLNSFCFGFRPVKKVNPYYLAYLLRSSGMRRKISFLAQGISRYNISKTKMMELEISIPNANEQEAIGTFFSTLDQQITLHQRKLEKLKNLKKALLNELFV